MEAESLKQAPPALVAPREWPPLLPKLRPGAQVVLAGSGRVAKVDKWFRAGSDETYPCHQHDYMQLLCFGELIF